MRQKVVLLFSGGLDSTALFGWLHEQDYEVDLLSVDYGQRHRKELEAAARIAALRHRKHTIVDLRSIGALLPSALTTPSIDVPDGHYTHESMKATVVPNRNMIFLALAIGRAQAIGASLVAFAAHAGDHAIYADCRPEFVQAMSQAALIAAEVGTISPFIDKTKAEIVTIGNDNDAPLAMSWSCYKGGERHCGRCGTCVERREAFALAGVRDRTDYALDAV